MVTIEEVKRLIEAALPGAQVRVGLFSGNDHFQAEIAAPQFNGKSLVEQHRMVYAAIDGLLGDEVHAMALKTRPLDSPAGD